MGYLLANFNSRFTNQRTDEYGGSIENRGRFMRELIDGIKQATPDNPLVVRLNGAELMDKWGGNTEDECFELMQRQPQRGQHPAPRRLLRPSGTIQRLGSGKPLTTSPARMPRSANQPLRISIA